MLSIIVAHDSRRGIGKENTLPWHIPEDLKRFKDITSGHPIIMGRKTYESIGRILPGRTNYIITRNSTRMVEGAFMFASLGDALKKAKDAPGGEEIFIIGGGQIFKEALPLADRLYITLVDGDFDADVFFPEYKDFKKIVSEDKGVSADNFTYKFMVVDR